MDTSLVQRTQTYLQNLCQKIDNRRVGSEGNRQATDFFARTVQSCGFSVDTPTFDCMDWHTEGVTLLVGDESFEAFASPYSLGCSVQAPLTTVSTVDELKTSDLDGQVVLLHGAIAQHQLMPKNFPFYNPDEHRHIIRLLEQKQPLAIIAATGRDEEMVGSLYPFPLFEDGDFDIPSVYMTDVSGESLLQHLSHNIMLESRSRRIPSSGYNVIAQKGRDSEQRVVVFAHIDTKVGTPGALDNASGVVVLLLLAELLADYDRDLMIELVALNGEDYYSNPGQQQYLAQNAERYDTIKLGVNLDGVGYHNGRIAYSLYECAETVNQIADYAFNNHDSLVPGEPWYQADHSIFLMNQIPALAFTSERLTEIMREVVHTAQDTPDVIQSDKLAELATLLNDFLRRLADDKR